MTNPHEVEPDGVPHTPEAAHEAIAIIGMSCRFAGDLNTPEEFWQFLIKGGTAVGELPSDRWEAYETSDPAARRVLAGANRRGSFRSEIKGFDAAFFGISPREAELMDPQQRMVLELAWEALEHAGIPPHKLTGTDAGVFVGVGADDYGRRMLEDLPGIEARSGIGGAYCAVANRISYTLDLRGPSLAVDTACSSSLVALHTACQALRLGETPLALVGGVLLVSAPGLTLVLDAAGATSPDGRSKPFDTCADGYGRGEGGGVLVLKRLSDARRDGDRILALIRGSAIHQDGRTDGIMAPSEEAQRHLLRRAYTMSGIDPLSVEYVEAHGTGTSLGDPIEAGAMISVFGEGRPSGCPCLTGSVKGNIGHLEAGAGVAGVIKTVLALTRGVLPPSVNLTERNPAIRWEGSGLDVVTELRPWPSAGDRVRRAGVSGYGYGGTIAHVILEEAPHGHPVASSPPGRDVQHGKANMAEPVHTQDCAAVVMPEGPAVYPLSARSGAGLAAAADRLADWLEGPGSQIPLPAIGHTLAHRRSHLTQRAAVVAHDPIELTARLRALASGEPGPGVVIGEAGTRDGQGPVWVFSGHGSQWMGMGQELVRSEPVFGKVLDELHAPFTAELGFSPRQALEDGDFAGVDVIQPLIFAVQAGLAECWRSFGVSPSAVIGHSVGEIAANVTAGALTLEEGARLVCRRSRLLRRVAGTGAMAMVGLSFEETDQLLRGRNDVSAAISASPAGTVVAGTPDAVGALAVEWRAEGLLVRPVESDVAFHSPQMDPLLDDLVAAAGDLRPRAPRIPVYSTALADPRSNAARDGVYWAANLRNPVRLAAAVEAALTDGYRLFTELSPHPVVAHSIRETVEAHGVRGATVLVSLRRRQPEQAVLMENVAAAHCAGSPVDWRALQPAGEFADLPTTAWQHAAYWLPTSRRSVGVQELHDPAGHTLLGGHSTVAAGTAIDVWNTTLAEDSRPYPGRHPVRGVEIVPAAVLLNTFLTAANGDPSAGGRHTLEDVQLRVPVVVSEPCEVQVVRQEGTIRLCTRPEKEREPDAGRHWLTHTLATVPPAVTSGPAWMCDPAELQAANPTELDAGFPIERLAGVGVAAMGFSWRVERLSAGPGSLLAHVIVPEEATGSWASLLDAALSIGSVVFPGEPLLRMPAGIRRVLVDGAPPSAARVSVRTAAGPSAADTVDVEVSASDGTVVAELAGLRYGRLDGDPGALSNPRRLVHELVWRPLPPRTAPSAELTEVAVLGDPELATALAEAWRQAGVSVLALSTVAELTTHRDRLGAGTAVLVSPAAPVHGGCDPAGTAWLLIATANELASRDGGPAPRLWAVTRGVREAAGPAALHYSPLWGLGRVLATEDAGIFSGVVDLGADDPSSEAAELLAVLRERHGEDIVALRPDGASVARLAPTDSAERHERRAAGLGLQCRPDSSYLITGGHGVLGLRTSEWLVSRGARRIVLAGRTPLPPRSSWGAVTEPADIARLESVRRMEEAGATVLSVSLDIADLSEARRVLNADALGLPPIRGVVHAAGVLESRLARDTGEESLRRVLRPKTEGALVLHELFPPGSLDFLALFSSAGLLLGLPSQASYASANAFLDALAAHRRAGGHRDTVSLGWTSWRGLGMSTSSEVIDAELNARGTGDITAAEAFGAWDVACRQDLGYAAVFRTLPTVPGMIRPPLLSDLAEPEAATGGSPQPSRTPWAPLPQSEWLDWFTSHVREEVAQEMRLPAGQLDIDRPLVEMGLDSIMTVAIRTRLQKQLGIQLPATLLWKHPTVAAISHHLLELASTAVPDDVTQPAGGTAPEQASALTVPEHEAVLP